MKKRILAWTFAVAMLGGGLSVQAQTVTTDNVADDTTAATQTQEQSKVQVSFKKLGGEIKDGRKNAYLVKIRGNIPVLTTSSKDEAVDEINAYYSSKEAAITEEKEETYQAAKKYYQDEIYNTDESTPSYWKGYELRTTYSLAHQDENTISFMKVDTSYKGTQQFKRTIENFDLKTGKLLTFKDIVTDEAKANAYIRDYINDEIKDAVDDNRGYLYYGYKDHVDECLAEGNWYLSDSSIVIVMNESVFTPLAEGTHTFYIPMSTFPYLNTAYKK